MKVINRVKLSNVAELITKGTTPTTLGYSFQPTGINFLKIECFDDNGTYIKEKIAHITEECNDKLKRSQLRKGDILFSIAGAIGRVAIVTEEMLPANTNQALAIIRISSEDVHLPYIKLILTSPIVKKQFERKKQGVAQLNLSLKDIGDLEIPLVEKEKQVELVELFAKVMNVIEARKQQLQQLDELVKARFVEMFGDRLEGNTVKLSTLTAVITKGTTPTTLGFDFTDSGINFVKIECITEDSKFIFSKMLHISEECNQKLKRSILQEGDVLFSIAGAIGRTAIVTKEILPANTNQAVAIIRLRKDCGLNVKFLNQTLHSSLVEKQVNIKKAGVAQINLSLTDIGDFNVIVPPMEEQEQFANFVEQVDKSKVAVQKALYEAQMLFDSLMQKYFG